MADVETVTVPVPWSQKPLIITGAGTIGVLQMVALLFIGYVSYEQVQSIRELSCLIAQDPDKRLANWGMCKAYANGTQVYK